MKARLIGRCSIASPEPPPSRLPLAPSRHLRKKLHFIIHRVRRDNVVDLEE
jgi:hypothetical protein